MTRKRAELIRNPGSVLVGVRTPNAVIPVPALERAYSDWADVAAEIASDVAQATPETLTTQPHETTPSVASVDEIRVYRVVDGQMYRVYTGEYTVDIDDRCQAHADLSGCVVWLMSATDAIAFDPTEPNVPTTPPIQDSVVTNTVMVYNEDTGELVWVGDETKGFADRCQKYADTHTVTLKVVSNGGMLTRFYVPRKVSLGYVRENAKRMQKAVEVVGEVVSMIAIGVVGWASLIVL